jgi:hypothetical protein
MRRQKFVTYAYLLIPLLLGLSEPASAQTNNRQYWAEGYAYFGRRTTTPGTSVGGAGGEVFVYRGLAAGGDIGTTVGNPDDRLTISSADLSYHFLCCREGRKVEPFVGAGFSYLAGGVNTHGITYPGSSQDRSGPNFSQGVIVWPTKHIGAQFELREYRFFVSYGPLENVIPGGHFVEFRIGLTFR